MSATPFEVNEIIRRLDLEPHPEGGHFRRTWQHPESHDGRPLASSILYLLTIGQVSHWHRIDAVEQWHFYAGDPMLLEVSVDGRQIEEHLLGPDTRQGHHHQVIVPARAWQSASGTGVYSLVGCTVTPAFQFEHFELAADGWRPGP